MSKIGNVLALVIFISNAINNGFSLPDEIYGASVHWRPTGANSIALSYRLVWKRTLCGAPGNWNGDTCYKNTFLTGTKSAVSVRSYFNGYKWRFRTGNASVDIDLSDLYFTDIGVLHEIAYETGVGITTVLFDPKEDTANILLSLMDSSNVALGGLGNGHLNMAVRNDTKRANISPLLNVFPVYRIPLGCSSVFRLFPFDGDGDFVKCHWDSFPLRSDKEIHAVLNEDLCELTVQAVAPIFQAGDTLHISLYAEDYSRFPVKLTGDSNDITTGPFSRTPLKLIVYIGNASVNCDKSPTFTRKGTLIPYFKRSYILPFQHALVKLPFETNTETDRILTTGPRYMTFEQRQNGSQIEEGVWNNLIDPSMKGIHQACGTAYTHDGIPGESRCAVLMVNDLDECKSNPCNRAPGGICDNLFEYYTCTYPGDLTYDGSKWTAPCKPERIVEKADDNLGVKVGLPVGLSLLLLLIVVGVTMYLKRYWTEKLKNSVVEPDTPVCTLDKNQTEKDVA
ncbi:uncharacterized protein LOC132729287 [Ruditapes philippinarum]|uniref:uncharacterized protein LOC132729287 n=1 Tax=Ruditapes philippinarum TaxID=129788 RepID=UPI00295BE26A|nr:uncharacterized protein LOC132729287 [Ruditapes philippinarum]